MRLLRKILILVEATNPGTALTAIFADGASTEGYDITTYEVKDEVGACRYYKITEQ